MQEYRSSVERHNAPYRGVSKREDAVNFHLSFLHDLFHIQKISGGNPLFEGHKDQLVKNLGAIFQGGAAGKASIPTAGKLITIKEKLAVPSLLENWTALNGVNRTSTQTGYRIDSPGLLVEGGLKTLLTVNPGDLVQIRFKLRKGAGQEVKVAVGALNFTSEGDDLKIVQLDDFLSGHYVEKRLRCHSRQQLELVVYTVYETKSGVPTHCFLDDFSVSFLSETEVGLQGLNNGMKQSLSKNEEILDFLEDRLLASKNK